MCEYIYFIERCGDYDCNCRSDHGFLNFPGDDVYTNDLDDIAKGEVKRVMTCKQAMFALYRASIVSRE